MKIVQWNRIGRHLIAIKKIRSLRVNPRSVDDYSEGTNCNKFIYVTEGKGMCVSLEKERLMVGSGMLIYVPQEEKMKIEWSEDANIIFLDFVVEDSQTSELLKFDNNTQLVFRQTPPRIREIFEHMARFFPSVERGTLLRCQKLFFDLLYEFSLFIPEAWLVKGNNHKLTEAINYTRKHYNENFTVKQLAEHCGYSPSRLRVTMKSQIGKSPIEYRNQLRIEKACDFLITTNMSVEDIAVKVGFQDVFYFSNCFKKYIGISPSGYRRKSTR